MEQQSVPVPPFVWICGRPYLVINWDLDSLPGPQDHLLLRPLAASEASWLQHYMATRDNEAWACLVVREDDRFGVSRNKKKVIGGLLG